MITAFLVSHKVEPLASPHDRQPIVSTPAHLLRANTKTLTPSHSRRLTLLQKKGNRTSSKEVLVAELVLIRKQVVTNTSKCPGVTKECTHLITSPLLYLFTEQNSLPLRKSRRLCSTFSPDQGRHSSKLPRPITWMVYINSLGVHLICQAHKKAPSQEADKLDSNC